MRNGPGPTGMLRADLDALPVQEQTGLPYASRATGVDRDGNQVPVMHACGHDIHMTVLVGTARRLARAKDRWRGTLMLIGQPAEERSGGAKAMLAEGLFEKFPRPDFNLLGVRCRDGGGAGAGPSVDASGRVLRLSHGCLRDRLRPAGP